MHAPDLPKLDYFQLTRQMSQMAPMSGLCPDGAGQMKMAGAGGQRKPGRPDSKGMDIKGVNMLNSPETHLLRYLDQR